jgi:hypothetical protein
MHDARLLYAAVQGMRPIEIEAEYQQATSALVGHHRGVDGYANAFCHNGVQERQDAEAVRGEAE